MTSRSRGREQTVTTTLYLIRHGATDQNDARPIILQGCGIDGPLSATGRWQAAQVANVLSRFPLTAVVASPLLRAQQTAAAIAEPHHLPVETIDALHEVNVGEWEGHSWEQIMRDDPDAYARFMDDPETVPYRGGESYTDVLQRTKPVLQDFFSRYAGQSIAVVAHSVVNRVLLADLLGLPLPCARDLRQSNCCVNVVRRKSDAIEVLTLNAELTLLGEGVRRSS
jgi:broad specificity phosphatase PhoE